MRNPLLSLVLGTLCCCICCSGTFLSGWMGETMSVIGNQTILDLSLPGTHDTLTFDLSLKMSDGGIDGDSGTKMARIIHELSEWGVVPEAITELTRRNAQTQALNISAQLDNGIRFLDFRAMLEYDSKEWYGLHMLMTNQPAITYLSQIKDWIVAHPTELVTLWISKHGSECATGNGAYPNVSIAEKQAFWARIETLFGDLLVDSTRSSLETTPLATLIQTNQRVLIFAADYHEFTNSSNLAFDSCQIKNLLIGDLYDLPGRRTHFDYVMRHSKAWKEVYRQQRKFWLISGALSQGDQLLEESVRVHFDPLTKDRYKHRLQCAALLQIPGSTTYCPDNLESDAAIANYYTQESIMHGLNTSCPLCDLPNAMYIDAVDYGGTIRTGLRRVSDPPGSPVCLQFDWTECTRKPSCPTGFTANGEKSSLEVVGSNGSMHGLCINPLRHHYKCCRDQPEAQNSARFGYVAAFVLANLQRSCLARDNPLCPKLLAMAQSELDAFPVRLWEDSSVARLVSWPGNVSNATCPKCHP